MKDFSYLSNADPSVIESFHKQYLDDPNSVDLGWRKFFEGFEFGQTQFNGNGHTKTQEKTAATSETFEKELGVLHLIEAYRHRGHLFTKTNPVRARRKHPDPLTLESFGLNEKDLDTVFQAGVQVGLGATTLRNILELLTETYCHSVGAEFVYIRSPQVVDWLRTRMETTRNKTNFSKEDRIEMLKLLTHSILFEKFMHSRFVGQKRFSSEGTEAFIPAMDAIVEQGAEMGIQEFVIGMAHRGRLSLLAGILGKRYDELFSEFEGKSYATNDFSGDVKYHLGHTAEKKTRKNKKVKLSLVPNPSHLEAVDPVVEGIVRARVDLDYKDQNKIIPILIHGDASIAGQGIVYEMIQMSLLDGYKTGGTLHIVLNNQIGFTTNYTDGRSSTYCTDVAKITLSPVFHVNGDDVEAVAHTIKLALEFRQTFNRDVFIDILGYRKHGHNEADEPRFTQPLLYKAIAAHPSLMEIYKNQLLDEKLLTPSEAERIETEFQNILQESFESSKKKLVPRAHEFNGDAWKTFRTGKAEDFANNPDTGVDRKIIDKVLDKLTTLPADKKFFNKMSKIFADRKKLVESGKLDWALAEQLAWGTLLLEGHPVRLSGEDSQRGTFSHRHGVIKLEDSEEEYTPLNNLAPKQAQISMINSLLSEYGVMGFDYGYSIAAPDTLTMWEAQFGDFANAAQIIYDQYVFTGESKWKQQNGLVLLLPHGSEGQGPEHSSARIERFLAVCAEYNMQVANCMSPANFFHIIRRQLKRPFRKPLVLMTPKSPLRNPLCISSIEDFLPGTTFKEILDDNYANSKAVTRVLLCSGKIYFDLLDRQLKDERKDVAVIRIEQLYPMKTDLMEKILGKYKSAKEFIWVQEEPENMGAWPYLRRTFTLRNLDHVSRRESCAPATGFPEQHELEQKELTVKAFK